MSEEPPNPEYVDLNERRTYRVVISGENVMIPVDQFFELPVYLADGFIVARKEDVQTAGQQALSEELTAYLNEQFPGIADGDFTRENVTLEPIADAETE